MSKLKYSKEQSERMKRMEDGARGKNQPSAMDNAKDFASKLFGSDDEESEKKERFKRLRGKLKR